MTYYSVRIQLTFLYKTIQYVSPGTVKRMYGGFSTDLRK